MPSNIWREYGSEDFNLQGLCYEMGSDSESGGRGVSSPPPERMVKSTLHKKDVVVSAWFVGAQQGEAVSEMVSGIAVSLWLV